MNQSSRLVVSLIFLLTAALHCSDPYTFGVTRFVTGQVERVDPDGQVHPLSIGDAVSEGDEIRTYEAAAAEIQVHSVGLLRLGPNSTLALSEFVEAQGQLRLRLDEGRAGIFVEDMEEDRELIMATPTVTAAVRGTQFLVGADAAESKIALFEGEVDVGAPDSETTVQLSGEGEVRLNESEALSEESIEPLSAESRAEMQELIEMTAFDRQSPPNPSVVPRAVGEGEADIEVPD